MDFKQQYQAPEWKCRRLMVLVRDDFTCKCGHMPCNQVHHKVYCKNKSVWQYGDDFLETICETCHKKFHFSSSNRYVDRIPKYEISAFTLMRFKELDEKEFVKELIRFRNEPYSKITAEMNYYRTKELLDNEMIRLKRSKKKPSVK